MADPLLVHLSNKIQEKIKTHSDDLSRGSAKDFSAYQYHCGIIRGLSQANGLLMEIAERMDSDDD